MCLPCTSLDCPSRCHNKVSRKVHYEFMLIVIGVRSTDGCVGWRKHTPPLVTRTRQSMADGKPAARLFVEPLPFENGAIVLRAGYWPWIDLDAFAAHSVRTERYRARRVWSSAW